MKESYVAAQESLLEGVTYWKSKAAQATITGLKGRLGNSLLSIVKHDFADAARKAYRKHEVTESQIDTQRKAQGEEVDTAFLDTLPSPEPMPEEPIDLKSLGLNMGDLTRREYSVVKDLYQALREGIPLTEYWDKKDYDKNIKALNRAKAKLKKH